MQEEEFYMGTNKKLVQKKHSFNIKIIVIITLTFFALGIAFIMYKHTFMTAKRFDVSVLDEEDMTIKAMTKEDAVIISQSIEEYFSDKVKDASLKILIEENETEQENSTFYNLRIYDNNNYLIKRISSDDKTRTTEYEMGTINIDFPQFESLFFRISDMISVDADEDDHGIVYPDGITYYSEHGFDVLSENTAGYDGIREYIFSNEFINEKKDVLLS